MSDQFKGRCLCGAVEFTSAGPAAIVGNCYCVDCRKSSGTSHCTHIAIPEAGFETSGSPTRYDRPADSGNVVSRHFCSECGSPVFSQNTGMPGMIFLRASVLDEAPEFENMMSVYTSRAPGWSLIDTSKPCFSEMPEGGPQSVLSKG